MLIRREDFGSIEKLTRGSKKKIWFTCEKCEIGILQSYRNYLKQNSGKYCRKCRNRHTANRSDVKEKQSKFSKNRWKNGNYRKHMKDVLSPACKEAWNDEERKKWLSENNPMKNPDIVKKVANSEAIKEKELKKICEEYGYEYITRKLFQKGGQRIIFKCNNGHIQEKRLDSFRGGHYRCLDCLSIYSNSEKEIADFILSLNIEISKNTRSIIPPYELDIVIPSKRIAIEYCGIFWHGENKGKDKNYHLNKLNSCNKNGYRLITIFEDEWIHKRDIVMNRIRHILNKSEERIYARKCIIKPIETNKAKSFIEKYHIQGYTGSKIKLGAFYKDKLISIMTFSSPSISKGRRNKDKVFELSRFCTSKSVIGITSKLLKYFQRNYNWEEIYSYADRRWSEGNVYKKVGFDFIHYTKPNYFYIDIDNIKRIHRFNYRKNVLKNKLDNFDPNRSEWENMKKEGWDRIWDCGNILFTLYK